jgi:hypothetical protein
MPFKRKDRQSFWVVGLLFWQELRGMALKQFVIVKNAFADAVVNRVCCG